jgi:predicted nucleic acid-binding protein
VILADSSVLIDVINADPAWCEWSMTTLEEWRRRGGVLIDSVIYAEISPEFDDPATLDALLGKVGVEYREIPREALFLAAKAHRAYRRRGGTRGGVLADFFVGAHAAVLEIPLLTRDPRRVGRYFPSVRLITPDG